MKKSIFILAALLTLFSCEKAELPLDNPATPEKPSVVNVPVPDVHSLMFSWDEIAGVNEYTYVLRNRLGKALSAGKTEYNSILFTDLIEGNRYFLIAKANNGLSQSEYCSAVEGIPGGVIIPESPENLKVTGIDYETISYSWDATPDTKKYLWFIKKEDGTPVKNGDSDTTVFTVDNLERGVSYLFSVKSWNDGKTSAETESVGAMTASDDDYLSLYLAGKSFSIDGHDISRSAFPKYLLRKPKYLTETELKKNRSDVGIIFLDNTADSTNTYSYVKSADLVFGDSLIVVGRFRRKPQPVLKNAQAASADKVFRLFGEILFKNVRFEASNLTYGLFRGKAKSEKYVHGVSKIFFDDCTVLNTTTGLYKQQVSSATMFHTWSMNNCILRLGAAAITSSGVTSGTTTTSAQMESTTNARAIIFKNCIFASNDASAAKSASGCVVALYNPKYEMNNLDIVVEDCSFYNFSPSQGNAFVMVTNFHSVSLDRCIAQTSMALTKSMYVVRIYNNNNCTAPGHVSGWSFYKSGSYDMVCTDSKAKIQYAGGDGSFTYSVSNAGTSVFGTVDAANDYFPSAVDGRGATYTTKYWINR